MKNFLCLFAVSLAMFVVVPVIRAEPTEAIPVRIFIAAHDDVYRFEKLGVSVEELGNGFIEARVTPSQMAELRRLGWRVEPREVSRPAPDIISAYHDYVWLSAKLDSVRVQYPAITKKISIGSSVQGRQLWAFLISDNPEAAENEPEVRFASNIHGDEVVGKELCIAMIDSLTRGYAAGVPEIVELVNSREIWFLPLLNPDGNTAGGRYNANSVDLNRNYPQPYSPPPGNIQPETQAMMNWTSSKRFVFSTMYHGGELVVNYQWDFSDSISHPLPDHRMIREVSLGYARRNPTIYSAGFDSGTVFGYYWYPAYGTLQDWSYFTTSCVDLTIEVSDDKWPAASTLPGFWNDNRHAMLQMIRQAGWGLQGVVTEYGTGSPLNRVQIDVAGISKTVWTDSLAGDYHRMLLTGRYDVTFSKDGYTPKTVRDVRVRLDSLATVDAVLFPQVLANLSGTVTDSVSSVPLEGAVVELVGQASDTSDTSGGYYFKVFQEYYTVRASKPGYLSRTIPNVPLTGSVVLDISLAPLHSFTYLANDTVVIPDAGPGGPWVADTIFVDRAVGIDGYQVFVNISHTYVGDLIVRLLHPGGDSVTLHRRTGGAQDNLVGWYDAELTPYDSLSRLFGLPALGNWVIRAKDFVAGYPGSLNGWGLQVFSTQSGVAQPPTADPQPACDGLELNRPNPFAQSTSIRCQVSKPGTATIKIYNLSGQLVRTLIDGSMSVGRHDVAWNGRDDRGRRVSPGVYLYRFAAGGFSSIGRMTLVK